MTVHLADSRLDAQTARNAILRIETTLSGRSKLVLDLSAVGEIEPEACTILGKFAEKLDSLGGGLRIVASGSLSDAIRESAPDIVVQPTEAAAFFSFDSGGYDRLAQQVEVSRFFQSNEPRPEFVDAWGPPYSGVLLPRGPEPQPATQAEATPSGEKPTGMGFDMGTFLTAFFSHKWILLAIFVVAIGAGLVAAKFLGKAIFETEAVLLYKPSDNELSDEYEVLQNIDPSTTFIYRQGSRKERLQVGSVAIKTLLNTVKIPKNMESVRAALKLKVPLNTIGSAVRVGVQKETELMTVHTTWEDPETAAALTNVLVDVFIESNKAVNKENLIDMQARLSSRYKDVLAKWKQTESDLKVFTDKHNIVDIKKESEQVVQELVRLRSLRDDTSSRRATLQVQIKSLDQSISDLTSQIKTTKDIESGKPSNAEIEAKIASLTRQLEDANARRGAQAEIVARQEDLNRINQLYKEGLATKSELDRARADYEKATLAGQSDQETTGILTQIDSLRASLSTPSLSQSPEEQLLHELTLKRFDAKLELVAVEGSFTNYDNMVKNAQKAIDTLPAVNKEYAQLTTDAAGLSAEVKGLEKMVAQADTALAKGSADFKIISQAPIPVFATSSNRKTILIAFSFVILLIGWGSIAAFELFDRRIRSPAEARLTLGLPILSVLPRSDRNKIMPGTDGDPALIEKFRLLALRLRREVPGKGVRILLASPTGSGGKSLVAANLGLVWGRSDERVLILDTETRGSAEAWPLAGLDTREATAEMPLAGTGEYLTYRAQDLGEIATQSIMPGVDLVTRGAEEALPDLLGSNRFRELLESASKTYSIVVLEAPAVLGFADAAIVAKNCDAVIMCIRARTVTPREVEQAITELGHKRVLGVVFTDVIPAFNRE